ncbi:hypothetical protein EDM57_17860 [Brevibacillus gelatini]|uniref:Uncharacterized protein n=1 Tax=Brevibacillus gelatini TaxID=1655277 RepID=A0A3M8ASN1_9BACL|nr:hypothetical protein EDM57_17860 [Brevibacillus gelatini]
MNKLLDWLMYYDVMYRNGKQYNIEVLYDAKTNQKLKGFRRPHGNLLVLIWLLMLIPFNCE